MAVWCAFLESELLLRKVLRRNCCILLLMRRQVQPWKVPLVFHFNDEARLHFIFRLFFHLSLTPADMDLGIFWCAPNLELPLDPDPG